jgi:histidine triad (HIT) family protein
MMMFRQLLLLPRLAGYREHQQVSGWSRAFSHKPAGASETPETPKTTPSTKQHVDSVVHHKPEESIFARIVGGSIPVKVLYEDDLVMAFPDVNPQAPTHILVVPKTPIGGPSEFQHTNAHQKQILGHLLQIGAEVARQQGIAHSGYRFVINEGRDGCQSIRWLHLHVLGGRPLGWPPG